MALKNRLERLENTSASNLKTASITYTEGEQTKAAAIAEFESKNGSLGEFGFVFFTMFEKKPDLESYASASRGCPLSGE